MGAGEHHGARPYSDGLGPKVTVQGPILNHFADMAGFDALSGFHIGKRPAHFQDPVIGAGG